MRENARRALIVAFGVAVLAAGAWAARDLPDPVGERVEAACAEAIPREGRSVEIAALDHERAPSEPEDWGPTGPAGDTLHLVEIGYGWRAPDGAHGTGRVRCAYVDEAASAGFDPARLDVETADAAGRP